MDSGTATARGSATACLGAQMAQVRAAGPAMRLRAMASRMEAESVVPTTLPMAFVEPAALPAERSDRLPAAVSGPLAIGAAAVAAALPCSAAATPRGLAAWEVPCRPATADCLARDVPRRAIAATSWENSPRYLPWERSWPGKGPGARTSGETVTVFGRLALDRKPRPPTTTSTT